ncbi:MAG: hypothetical protein LAT67_12640 [Balneolales bacterium]|nr:hypothetical protein [Balneolales bacterium]
MLRKRSNKIKDESEWNIKAILLESCFILLAVLLALLLNEWNNERNNQKLIDKILESAQQEIAENLEIINQTVEYRGQLLREIRSGTRVIQRIENFSDLADFEFTDKQALSRFLDKIFIEEGALDLIGNELYPAPDGGYLMSFYGAAIKINMDGKDLVAYGPGNIQLRTANLSDVVWTTANASNALIKMDFETLTLLADIYSTQKTYHEISQQALNLLYSQISVTSAMEDMYWLENELQSKYTAFLSRKQQ